MNPKEITQTIAALALLLLIVGGIAAGVLLSQQSTDDRTKANNSISFAINKDVNPHQFLVLGVPNTSPVIQGSFTFSYDPDYLTFNEAVQHTFFETRDEKDFTVSHDQNSNQVKIEFLMDPNNNAPVQEGGFYPFTLDFSSSGILYGESTISLSKAEIAFVDEDLYYEDEQTPFSYTVTTTEPLSPHVIFNPNNLEYTTSAGAQVVHFGELLENVGNEIAYYNNQSVSISANNAPFTFSTDSESDYDDSTAILPGGKGIYNFSIRPNEQIDSSKIGTYIITVDVYTRKPAASGQGTENVLTSQLSITVNIVEPQLDAEFSGANILDLGTVYTDSDITQTISVVNTGQSSGSYTISNAYLGSVIIENPALSITPNTGNLGIGEDNIHNFSLATSQAAALYNQQLQYGFMLTDTDTGALLDSVQVRFMVSDQPAPTPTPTPNLRPTSAFTPTYLTPLSSRIEDSVEYLREKVLYNLTLALNQDATFQATELQFTFPYSKAFTASAIGALSGTTPVNSGNDQTQIIACSFSTDTQVAAGDLIDLSITLDANMFSLSEIPFNNIFVINGTEYPLENEPPFEGTVYLPPVVKLADYNADGFVDSLDYSMFYSYYGQTDDSSADFDLVDTYQDGIINGRDYIALYTQWIEYDCYFTATVEDQLFDECTENYTNYHPLYDGKITCVKRVPEAICNP